ncbi:MAG: aromatic ring-hydroxylating dioxygenase subunit alpha [Pseudomonadota bacterium]
MRDTTFDWDSHIASGPHRALPAMAYASEDLTQQEETAIFRTHWFSVGRADLVARPGDYIALDVAGQAILLLRDRKGVLRAFANACRHRGARLAEGAGRTTNLRCPFHSWMFQLSGELAAAPHMEEAAGFDRDAYSLIAYRAEERFGIAFICLNPDAPALDAQLGNFGALHGDWPLDQLKSLRRREMVVGCNWKAFLDVFNEYYHLPFVHPDSIDDIYQRPDAGDEATGAFASQFGGTDGTGGLLQTEQDKALPSMPGLKGRALHGVRYSWAFPNMSFAASSDAMWMYEAYPMGPDHCHVVQTASFPPETLGAVGAEEKLAAYLARLDAAIDEDIPALENQHRGLKCTDARPGQLHPLLEANVAGFARWYATEMNRAHAAPT